MKMTFKVLSSALIIALIASCGRAEETETPESNETTEVSDSEESSNSGGFNDLINGAVNQVENEVNHQLSDPNSELLQGIDTLKDVMEDKVVPAINEMTDKIKTEVEK